MDAKLIVETPDGKEIRYANKRNETWPGYHETAPLGKRGFWYGDHQLHKYIGVSHDDVEHFIGNIKQWGCYQKPSKDNYGQIY